jgi:hypothetical protein
MRFTQRLVSCNGDVCFLFHLDIAIMAIIAAPTTKVKKAIVRPEEAGSVVAAGVVVGVDI